MKIALVFSWIVRKTLTKELIYKRQGNKRSEGMSNGKTPMRSPGSRDSVREQLTPGASLWCPPDSKGVRAAGAG